MPSIARALRLVLLSLAACSSTSAPQPVVEIAAPPPATADAAPKRSEWKIGAFLGLTGPDAAIGIDAKGGIDLAIDEVNTQSGAQGRKLTVVWEDDHGNPKDAVEAVLRLTEDAQVVALLGDVTSARSKAGAIMANKRRVPMITPTATHPDVTKVGPFVFRACFDDVRQGKAAARYVVENARNKRIGLIFASDDPYSSGLAGAFRDEAAKRGAYLVEQRILHDETNPIAQLGAIARHNPDLVYVPVYYTMVPGIAKAARAAGIDGRRLVGSDGWEASQLLDEAGDLLEGAVFTDHWVADAPWPASRAFVAAYRRRFQRDPSTVAALGHDAAKLLADAIGRAENGSREAVQRALATTRGFEGATGTISMGPGGEPDHAVVIVRIEARRFHHHTIVRPDAP